MLALDSLPMILKMVVLDSLPINFQIALLNRLITTAVCITASRKHHLQLNTVLYVNRHAVIPLDQ